MVEINNFNVRRSSICWCGRRELITDVRNQKSWLWRHCRRRAIYRLPDHPSQNSVNAKPKTQTTGADATSFFPVGGMLTASSLAWKTSLRKVRTLALQQIKERGALPMIDRGDIRQAIDRCSTTFGLHCRALVMVKLSTRLTAWLQNSKKRAERSERLMYEQSHRDYLRSGYLHHRLPVMGC